MPSSSARWQTIFKIDDINFGVVVVEVMPGLFDLGGILWNHCCMVQREETFLSAKFCFAML